LFKFPLETIRICLIFALKITKNDRFCLKFFDITSIEKIEVPSLTEAPSREQSKNISRGAYIRINTVYCERRNIVVVTSARGYPIRVVLPRYGKFPVRYGTGIPGLPVPSIPGPKISRTFPYRPFPDPKFPVLTRTVHSRTKFPVATLHKSIGKGKTAYHQVGHDLARLNARISDHSSDAVDLHNSLNLERIDLLLRHTLKRDQLKIINITPKNFAKLNSYLSPKFTLNILWVP
jgi:hypothetical protein